MRSRGALRAFMTKELRHILRDRQTLVILLLLPLVQVVLFGYALRSDVRGIRLAVIDRAPDAATIALRDRFVASGRFRLVYAGPDVRDIERMFQRGEADMALVMDPELAGHLASGTPARLQLLLDASDPNTGTTMQAYAQAVLADYESTLPRGPAAARIGIATRMRFNPTLESVNLFVPGLVALVLTLVSALMTAISLSREKERGTMEILLVSPLRPWQIIAGKVLPYLALAMANVVTALFAAWAVFHVPFRGSLLLLLAESFLYSLVSLALGVLIAARTPTQRAAMFGALVGTMLPNVLLSGMIFPIASMPRWLAPVTNLVPARWFVSIARGIMLKGLGLEHLWRESAVLLLMMALLSAAAVRSLKPRLA